MLATGKFLCLHLVNNNRLLCYVCIVLQAKSSTNVFCNSIRSTERITKLHRATIMNLLVKAGERCQTLLANVVRNVPATDVQADEIWSYVGKKESNKGHGDTREAGDAWTSERNAKLVLAYELGKCTVSSATRFIDKLALATDPNRRFQLTLDGLNVYPYPVGNIVGTVRTMPNSSKSTTLQRPKNNAATALPVLVKPGKPMCRATQTLTSFALRTSSAGTDRFASGASA
jgi:hypothetical protein